MDACLFNVLHHAADTNFFAVGNRVHVHFNRIVKESIEQNRRIKRYFDRFTHIALKFASFMHDIHRAAAKHVARTNN